ncbi:MAG: hypothetical protein K6G25_02445 [Bacteroidales bacterium]|nr:hypothetical protein [Bacteroidales bacterium]
MKKTDLLTILAVTIILAFGINTANAQNGVSKVQDGKVSIEAIPTTLDEFKALQAELGTTPEGCIMLQLVAMEVYRHDRNVGRECLSLNNTSTNLSSVTSRLNELYRPNDSYARPYLVSSCFKGATPANGYNPNKPYTIELRRDPVRPDDERSQMLRGYVKYFQVYSDGYDTHWRNVDVVKQQGDDYYRVSNCPAILTQCKEIDFDATDEWHGLE